MAFRVEINKKSALFSWLNFRPILDDIDSICCLHAAGWRSRPSPPVPAVRSHLTSAYTRPLFLLMVALFFLTTTPLFPRSPPQKSRWSSENNTHTHTHITSFPRLPHPFFLPSFVHYPPHVIQKVVRLCPSSGRSSTEPYLSTVVPRKRQDIADAPSSLIDSMNE